MTGFSSAAYWDLRYRRGGTSGSGSYGRLGDFKAAFINGFVSANQIGSVIDLGCGDGNLLSMLTIPGYTGVDVSPTALHRCQQRFPALNFVPFVDLHRQDPSEMAMSIDVIFHLVEDAAYVSYMQALFDHARRYVLIYASDVEMAWTSPHVRHRRFGQDVAATLPAWRLAAHIPNDYPFDPAHPDETSFADFFVYSRASDHAPIRLPG